MIFLESNPFACWIVVLLFIFALVLFAISHDKNKRKEIESKKIEFKRTCNKCQKVWYVSKYNMERLKKARSSAGLTILTINAGQGLRNMDAIESELVKLESCPNCSSQDFSEIEEKLNK